MAHDYLPILAHGDRSSIQAKLREHDDALNDLELGAPAGFAATNGDSVALLPGMPVATNATNGFVRRAWAGSQAQASVLGLVIAGADVTLPVRVQPDGAVELSTDQWSAIVAEPDGLVYGARYYLDLAQPGRITSTPPTALGSSLTAIGRALSDTVLVLHITPYITQ